MRSLSPIPPNYITPIPPSQRKPPLLILNSAIRHQQTTISAKILLLISVEQWFAPYQHPELTKNQMNNETDATIVFFIMVAILIFDCIRELFCVLDKGIFKSQTEILMQKSKKELKQMLSGVRGISRLTKIELVELIIA